MNTAAQLSLRLATHGGRRVRAGRKAGARPRIRHVSRAGVSRHRPALVTVKVRKGLGSLRKRRIVRALWDALHALKAREGFRVVQFSLQADHAHFLVEADDAQALGRGMMALGSRLARIAQRELRVRGRVLADRYHLRVLCMPREVRAALAYVLLNARKHAAQLGRLPLWRIDPASSALWFTRWRKKPRDGPPGAVPVAEARTWLLCEGWLRHGLIDADRSQAQGPSWAPKQIGILEPGHFLFRATRFRCREIVLVVWFLCVAIIGVSTILFALQNPSKWGHVGSVVMMGLCGFLLVVAGRWYGRADPEVIRDTIRLALSARQ